MCFVTNFCLVTAAELHSEIHCSLWKMHLVTFSCQWGKIKSGCFSLTMLTSDMEFLVAFLLPLILCETRQPELVGKSLFPSKVGIIHLGRPLELNHVLLLLFCSWMRHVSVTLILIYFIWTLFMWIGCCRCSWWAEGALGLACSYCISREWKCLDC